MLVTVLGCGGSAGVPSLGGSDGRGDWGACDPEEPRNRRTRSSIVIEGPQGRLLVDTGPDMRMQLLAAAIPRIDAIIFTHAHADHIAGLDDVRLLNRVAGHPLPTYATAATRDDLTRRFEYVFRPWTPPNFYRPVLDFCVISPGETIGPCGLHVRTFEQDHHVMPTLGLRVGDFAYSTDVVRLDAQAKQTLVGVKTWLVGCFQREPHLTHADVAQVARWRSELGIERVILTHMGYDLDWAWMRTHLPRGLEPAHDGLIIRVESR